MTSPVPCKVSGWQRLPHHLQHHQYIQAVPQNFNHEGSWSQYHTSVILPSIMPAPNTTNMNSGDKAAFKADALAMVLFSSNTLCFQLPNCPSQQCVAPPAVMSACAACSTTLASCRFL